MKTITAVGRNVLIEPDPVPAETVSPGGIVLSAQAESAHDLRNIIYGKVVSIGSGGYDDPVDDRAVFQKPPDDLLDARVGYRKIDVKEVPHNNKTYHAVDFDSIVCKEATEGATADGR